MKQKNKNSSWVEDEIGLRAVFRIKIGHNNKNVDWIYLKRFTVVSIDSFHVDISRFRTMEGIKSIYCFLFVTS